MRKFIWFFEDFVVDEMIGVNWSEDRICQEFYLWYQHYFPEYRKLLSHIPNGGKRLPREAARFKSMGVTPGYADYTFTWNGKLTFIEAKKWNGTQDPEQIIFQSQVEAQGFDYYICNTLFKLKARVLNEMGIFKS